ncbi:DoxX family protein [Compostibacter hankyongensis]|uniref:DoxX family protein n=1 Tax=Compostibacter hankyongensis TaxID=1007089 RepID=A0ABP8FBD7_9BACT
MGKPFKIKHIAFWIVTALLVFELIDGALWDFNILNKGAVQGVLSRLGYPAYLAFILGSAKIPAAVAISLPRLKWLKEWAYAGLVFLFTGATVSHIVVKDYASVVFPLIFLLFTLLSWRLRPDGPFRRSH